MTLELSSFKSIRTFADNYRKLNLPIHILMNNAAVMALPKRDLTEQKLEMQFGVNHVGHFLLTKLLLDIVKKSSPSRIINVSSSAHRFSTVEIDDVHFEKRPYEKWKSYGQSKTANILFSRKLQEILDKENPNNKVLVLSLHPGVILTKLSRHFKDSDLLMLKNFHVRMKTIPQGASTQVFAAISPKLEKSGGAYLDNCEISPCEKHASDMDLANKLWDLSEAIVKNNP